MMTTLKEQVQDLPKGQYAEIGFDQFQADPLGELSRVYGELDLGLRISLNKVFLA